MARTPQDRIADKDKAINLAAGMRTDIDALLTAIAALPAPGVRNAAQSRDALMMRAVIRSHRFQLITSGLGTSADRADEPA